MSQRTDRRDGLLLGKAFESQRDTFRNDVPTFGMLDVAFFLFRMSRRFLWLSFLLDADGEKKAPYVKWSGHDKRMIVMSKNIRYPETLGVGFPFQFGVIRDRKKFAAGFSTCCIVLLVLHAPMVVCCFRPGTVESVAIGQALVKKNCVVLKKISPIHGPVIHELRRAGACRCND